MLLSMTGHGEATGHNERLSVTIEIRAVNNRHMKVSIRCPDAYLSLEPNIERVIRDSVARGTLQVQVRVRSLSAEQSAQLDETVLRQYWDQLKSVAQKIGAHPPSDLTPLLNLPGIVGETENRILEESDWPLVESVLRDALTAFHAFREDEGQAMAHELDELSKSITSEVDAIAARAPEVVMSYRDRLIVRINELIAESGPDLESKDLIREMSVYADRCDITEEITRLRSHLKQYSKLLERDESSLGRKLEFLGQEMFREINTIGSKANDVEIAHRVVSVKAAIEKMREIIQNIE